MKKKIFDLNELKFLGIFFIVVTIALQIGFYKDSILQNIRLSLSLFWLFVIPGYFAMLFWKENLQFLERTVIGTIFAAGIVGITSYYGGLLNFSLNIQPFILPPVIALIGIVAYIRKKDSHKD